MSVACCGAAPPKPAPDAQVGLLERLPALAAALCGVSWVLGLALSSTPLLIAASAFGAVPALLAMGQSLARRRVDVNVLMVTAAAGAIGIGRYDDSATLLFLFSLSGALEHAALGRARSAIEKLIELRPSRAWVVESDTEREIPVEDVRAGDLVRIPPHARVPVDATVVIGRSTIDASAMTGESVPVSVEPGAKVIGGTLNLEGQLTARATAAVGSTALDRVMELVREAQENKAGGERLSQWLGERYTWAVLGVFLAVLAVRTGVFDQALPAALQASLTLLVALSPCALVISVPAATLSALAWCGRNGLLVRGGEFIERAGNVTAVAFDKTGTLTRGTPRLVEVCACPPDGAGDCGDNACWHGDGELDPNSTELVSLAASAELHGPHPIARALLAFAESRKIAVTPPEAQQSVPGLGVRATVRGIPVVVGQPQLLEEQGPLPAGFHERIAGLRGAGMTVAAMRAGTRVCVFGAADEPRPEALRTIRRLRALGIRHVAMLTGDHRTTAAAVAQGLELDQVESELASDEKGRAVAALVAAHGRVMMVGDGANDAPSLAGAYLGVGMGGLGNEAALAASDVVIVRDTLDVLPDFLRLGRRTTSIIRANLILAGAMVVGLTIAAFAGVLPMGVAVVGHEGSTVLVILNGLRLLGGPGKDAGA